MNVVLVSHCDYRGNSAFHVHSVARELVKLGVHPVVCVPDAPEGARELGLPPFPVLSYADALSIGVPFPNGRGPDLIHAFTPREHVRVFVERLVVEHAAPYLVHLEDNEEVIVEDELEGLSLTALKAMPAAAAAGCMTAWRTNPRRGQAFMEGAAGVTALIEELLQFKPQHVPGLVFWPGFDPAFASVAASDAELRALHGVGADELVLVYTGNVHRSNEVEVRSLILAIGLLRRVGYPARLLKTGWNHVNMDWVRECGLAPYVTDLGFLPRPMLPRLLAAADVLVQPGRANRFNDYRFPSKLPEFLVSGKPVVLPTSNVGRFLEDGKQALLLERGDAQEISAKVALLAQHPSLRVRLGDAGRAFAQERLSWEGNVPAIASFYRETLQRIATGTARVPVRRPVEPAPSVPKLIAFYLPQFHPIPENDEWWGKGFTEWTNVARATPNFAGHYQPHLPADLGFYDLRVPDVMEAQAQIARAYGVHGFCFYHYWFNGRRVLERPVNAMLASRRPDFPFCLCWANENWTRRWDGLEDEVLLKQEYRDGWEDAFIEDLLPALTDPRYIRVEGAPLLLVYRANLLPDARRSAKRFREVARALAGLDLHLGAVQSFGIQDPRDYGMDAAVEFPPHTRRFLLPPADMPGIAPDFEGYVEDYLAVQRDQLAKPVPPYRWYRGVMPSWDNTARRGRRAHILVNSSPQVYEQWLRALVMQAVARSPGQAPLVFINAWNEWAEGTHLEPDQRYGHEWLERTRSALCSGIREYFALKGIQVDERELLEELGFSPDASDTRKAA